MVMSFRQDSSEVLRHCVKMILLLFLFFLCSTVAVNVDSIISASAYVPNYYWDGLASDATGERLYAMSFYPYRLYGSVDHGESWNFVSNFTMTTMATNSSGSMIAGLGNKVMWYSFDYGDTFNNVSIPLNFTFDVWLGHMAMSKSGEFVFAVTTSNDLDYTTIFRSNDSGMSYQNISSIVGAGSVNSIATNDAGNFVIVSCVLGILTSFDYGITFTQVSGAYKPQFSTMALDSTGQYVLGGFAGAMRSTNFGANWTSLSVTSSTESFAYSCSSYNGNVLYLAPSTSGYIYNSFDAGSSWNRTSFPYGAYGSMACNNAATQVTTGGWRGTLLTKTEYSPPTSQPSSQPTSVPTCTRGSGMTDDHSSGGGCADCAPGSYATGLGGVCEVCPVGYYTADYGETQCSKCPYPTKSVFDESDGCYGFSLDAGFTTTVVVMASLSFVVLVSVLSSTKKSAVIVNLIFPTLDLFSDIAYLMTNDFYSPVLFGLGVLFVVFPIPSFLYTLYRQKAVMPRLTWRLERLWWLSAGTMEQDHIYFAKFPCFGGDERFPLLSCAKHDNLCSLTLEGVVWVIAIVSQILTIVGYPLLIVANIVFLCVWLFVGMFLYLSKTIAVGNVWNLWFSLWTGVSDHNTEVDVDTEELNGSLQHEFYFETLPQVCLQLANNILLRDFTPLAIFSLVQSLVMALNGIWRFGYYRYVVKTPVPLKDIPIDMTIRLRMERFGIDMVLLDGRLEPNSKRDPNASSRTRADLKESLMMDSVVVDDDGKKVESSGRTSLTKKKDGDEEGSSGVGVIVEAISAVL